MDSYMDYTSPGTQFAFDVNSNPIFKKDPYNYLNFLSVKQLNTLTNLAARYFPQQRKRSRAA